MTRVEPIDQEVQKLSSDECSELRDRTLGQEWEEWDRQATPPRPWDVVQAVERLRRTHFPLSPQLLKDLLPSHELGALLGRAEEGFRRRAQSTGPAALI